MTSMKEYLRTNRERFLSELFSLIRIPSVSSSPEHKGDMILCAEKLSSLLLESGAERTEIFPTEGHPVVYGEKMVNSDAPTVLIYGHYDVQPEGDLSLWNTAPYEPVIRDGAIYARGANDDKGQIFMHIKVMEYLTKTSSLKHNLKFVFEGEEEIGSDNLGKWIQSHADLLACDVILVSDTTMISDKVPTINCGMRGLAYMQIDVKGPDMDLHSGHYGGAVINPANALCEIITRLKESDGKVAIPGFYDDVVELSAADRDEYAKVPFDKKEFEDSIGIPDSDGEKGYTCIERKAIRPCIDVNGIWSGNIGEGSMTIIPSEAHAKVSMRLVPCQNPDKIARQFSEYVKSIAPSGVKVSVTYHHGGNAFFIPLSSPAYQAASKAVEEAYGIHPAPARGGGSITILADMQKLLGAEPLLMGFGLERDAIHSPNESFLLSQFEKGMESIALFYNYYRK